MRKRFLILCAAGMLACSVPVYAAPGGALAGEEVLASSSVSEAPEVSAISTDAAGTADGDSGNKGESGAATVTQEAGDPVAHVISMISALPAYNKLNMNDEQVVDEVQTAYDDLSDAQKERVLNRETLARAQGKLQEIRDQSLYTYSFTLTDKYPVARMTLSYAPPSDDSLDTQVKLGDKTGEAAFEVVTPDGESFVLTPDTKSYDTKDVHFTVTWSNQSASIKAENSELGTWLMKSSYPVSFAVQKYESVDEMDGGEKAAATPDAAASSVSTSREEGQPSTAGDAQGRPANPFAGVIGMLAAVAGIGVGAVLLVKFLGKKRFAQPEGDEPAPRVPAGQDAAASQIHDAESMDDLDAIMKSKWMTDMDAVPDNPGPARQEKQQESASQAGTPAAGRDVQEPQEEDDDDYGFSDPVQDDGGNGDDASSDSMHDADFMDDDDDGDTSRDTTYLSYEEDINEETGILSDDGPTTVKHKQPFYPKGSYDPDSGRKG